MLLACDPLASPVHLARCPEVRAVLEAVTHGWHWRQATPGLSPLLSCHRDPRGYRVEAPWLREPVLEPTPVSAACSLIVDLIRQLTDEQADMLYLHAGAVVLGGGAVVFPSGYRAGKSTLVVTLAALGHRVLADDVLGLVSAGDGLQAVAPGISPRLRLPLPPSLPPVAAALMRTADGPRDTWYRYVRLPAAQLAPVGAQSGIRAFVFLQRVSHGPASLQQVDPGQALQHLLHQNFARTAPAGRLLETFAGLVRARPCLALRYADVADAGALLARAFQGASPDAHCAPGLASLEAPARPVAADRGMAPTPTGRLAQAPGIALHTVGGEHFLAGVDGTGVFGLTGIGPVIWQCLGEPVTHEEIAAALEAAYPEVGAERIAADVGALLAALAARGLIRPAAAP